MKKYWYIVSYDIMTDKRTYTKLTPTGNLKRVVKGDEVTWYIQHKDNWLMKSWVPEYKLYYLPEQGTTFYKGTYFDNTSYSA